MKKFKAVVRSISPFTKKSDIEADVKNINDMSTLHNNNSMHRSRKPTWNLSGVDFKSFLYTFYSSFNPEKISMIDAISIQYAGDEMIMIYQLAEKYSLSQADMQDIINESKTMRIGQQRGKEGSSFVDPQWKSQSRLRNENSQHNNNRRMDSNRTIDVPISNSSERSLGERRFPSQVLDPQRRAEAPVNGFNGPSPRDTHHLHQPPSQGAQNDMDSEDNSEDEAENVNAGLRNGRGAGAVAGHGSISVPSSGSGTGDLSSKLVKKNSTSSTPTTLQDIIKVTRQSDSAYRKVQLTHQEQQQQQQQSLIISNGASDRGYDLRGGDENDSQSQESGNVQFASTSGPHTDTSTDRGMSPRQIVVSRQPLFTATVKNTFVNDSSGVSTRSTAAVPVVHLHHERATADDSQLRTNSSSMGTALTRSSPYIDLHEGEASSREREVAELREELDKAHQALMECDKERKEAVQLLEAVVVSPEQMRRVVEEYLESCGKKRQAAVYRNSEIPVSGNRHLSNNNVLPSPHATRFSNLAKEDFLGDRDGLSVGELSTSSSKNSLHIHQLEGMQSQPGPSRAASGQGTVLSAKRSEEMATTFKTADPLQMNARLSGITSPYAVSQPRLASPSPYTFKANPASPPSSTSLSLSLTGGINNKIKSSIKRPVSAGSSVSGSLQTSVKGGSRNSSPASSQSGEKYQLAKRYGGEVNSSQFSELDSRADSRGSNSAGGGKRPGAKRVGDPADDWVEYADQKTKRKYYYSASRKKSTWSLPSGGMGAPESASNSRTSSPANSRSASPNPMSSARAANGHGNGNGNSNGSMVRSGSSDSLASRERSLSAGSMTSTDSSGREKSSWVAATDPKSGRTYWYNRSTRESTWKKPYEE